MRLNWQGHGQKHYDLPAQAGFNGGYLRLEWQMISGEMIYSLTSHRITRICSQGDGKCSFNPPNIMCPCYEPKAEMKSLLLSFRIPDFSWQSPEPSFFPFQGRSNEF